jgi:hypothetical protein
MLPPTDLVIRLNWKLGRPRCHFGILRPLSNHSKKEFTMLTGWLILTTKEKFYCYSSREVRKIICNTNYFFMVWIFVYSKTYAKICYWTVFKTGRLKRWSRYDDSNFMNGIASIINIQVYSHLALFLCHLSMLLHNKKALTEVSTLILDFLASTTVNP